MRAAASGLALLGLVGVLGCPACSSSDAAPSAPDAAAPETTFGGARPVDVRVPAGYDPNKPAPLLLVLHGYGSGGVINDVYMKMTSIADAKGFFYVSPDGTTDQAGKRFWNANDGCCNFYGSDVDDVGYLTSLVHDIQAAYAIDPKRIFVMGHSNGGYMTNRLACDHAELFAAAVSWAGANWSDPSRCQPSAPIGFLQIHGTKDSAVPFDASTAGGPGGTPYPGAAGTVAIWAQKNGCQDALVPTGTTLQVNADSPGPDAKVARHDGCAQNGAAELWPVEGADHIFTFTPEAVDAIWQFLESHAKP
jgi:polyhydroxybutyrate depolymerase